MAEFKRKSRSSGKAGAGRPTARRGAVPKKPLAKLAEKPQEFSVLIVAHRPRYRARVERACKDIGAPYVALLNSQDPIGIIHRDHPSVVIYTVDVAEKRNTGYLRASQAYRSQGLSVLGLFDVQEEREALAESCDDTFVSPWTADEIGETISTWRREFYHRNSANRESNQIEAIAD